MVEEIGMVGKREKSGPSDAVDGCAGCGPRTTYQSATSGTSIYPYLLQDMKIRAPDEVWCSDITYIPMRQGYLYLIAIMDWFSRYVLEWELSNSLETAFCLIALERSLIRGQPGIFNTDQGAQFTSRDFSGCLKEAGIQISMDGRGRFWDNIFIERLWRSLKYEEVYIRDYADGNIARQRLRRYFRFYNTDRPHQALGYRTPAEVYQGGVV